MSNIFDILAVALFVFGALQLYFGYQYGDTGEHRYRCFQLAALYFLAAMVALK